MITTSDLNLILNFAFLASTIQIEVRKIDATNGVKISNVNALNTYYHLHCWQNSLRI